MTRIPVCKVVCLVIVLASSSSSLEIQSAEQVYLALNQSVRSLGLGNMGAVLVDHRSYTGNPASLALMGGDNSRYVVVGPIGLEHLRPNENGRWTFGGAISVSEGGVSATEQISYGAGYYFSRKSFGEYELRGENNELLGFGEIALSSHNLVLAAAHNGRINLAFGTTVKLLREERPSVGAGMEKEDGSASSLGFDLGALAQFPVGYKPTQESGESGGWSLTPSWGASYHNLLASFEHFEGAPKDDVQNTLRLAVGLRGIQYSGNQTDISILIAGELERLSENGLETRSIYHLGGELGLYAAAYFRYGYIDPSGKTKSQQTWGIGISSKGVIGLITSSQSDSADRWWSKVSLELNFAKYEVGGYSLLSNTEFLDASLTLSL